MSHAINILYSLAWMVLGNKSHAVPASHQRFHDLFAERLCFMGRIKLNTVDVLSHLGDIIPVPTIFCSTWKVRFITFLVGQLTQSLC
jgi:hypothetical protein